MKAKLLLGTIAHEWRRLVLSPVWMLGLTATLVLALSEAGSSKVLGYPSTNQALYGFQLGCSVLLGLVAFLLTSGSVAADLAGSRKDLVFSRSAPKWLYLAGKLVGGVSFSLGLALMLALACAATPLWHGALRVHDPRPFLLVILLCVIPMLCFVCALAMFLTVVFRAVVIALPLMLIYFFAAALPQPAIAGQVNLVDFTQRLYPRELLIEVPLRLSEYTFSGLLDPVAGTLVGRGLLYSGLGAVLFLAAWWLLARDLEMRIAQPFTNWAWKLKQRRTPAGRGTCACSVAEPRSGIAQRWDKHEGAPLQALLNELRLFFYSAKLMAGRNIVAMGLICAGLVFVVVTYGVSPYQTREGILLFQMEMFAPLLGIAMFSDLVAAEFEARRAELLRVSSHGAAWLLVRRLIHAALITGLACVVVLGVLRVAYTRFDFSGALATIVPGTLLFGTIALLAGAVTRQTLVGYGVGTGALILGLTLPQIEPLTPVSFQMREHLANSRLLGEYNWLLAKGVYLGLSLMLAAGVILLVREPRWWRRMVAGAAALILGVFSGLHLLWAAPSRAADSTSGSREFSRVETNGIRWVRRADTAVPSTLPKALPATALVDVRSVRKDAGWQVEGEIPVDLTREFEIRHLELDASVAPATAMVDAEARFGVKVLAGPTDQLLFYLGAELEIHQMLVNERPAAFTKSANLVQVKLDRPVQTGNEPVLRVYYSGKLRLPQNLRYERSSRDLLFVTTRFYPSLRAADARSRNLFTCRATIRTPTTHRLAGAEFIKEERGENVFLWESRVPVDNLPLFVGTFREYRGQQGKTPISFCAFNADAEYAKRALVLAAKILEEFEPAFGPFPFARLAIVENRYQSAGGAAFPGLVTMKPERLVPEHQQRFLDGYLPHEIAHAWWGGAFPPWIAEGGAVFASAYFLERQKSPEFARELMEKEFRQAFLAPSVTPAPLVTAQGITAYVKGAYLFQMLEAVSGEAAVVGALRHFLEEHTSEVRLDWDEMTDRMIRQLKSITKCHQFIDDWSRGIERFDPELAAVDQSRAGAAFEVRLQLRHAGKVRFPVPVRVTLRSGATQDVTWSCTNDTGELRVCSAEEAAFAELDPSWQLLDWDRSNNRLAVGERRQRGGGPMPDRFVGWKTYTTSDGFPGRDVRCFAFSSSRDIYAGISSFEAAVNRRWAVACYRDGWTRYEPKAEPVLFVNAVSCASDGSLWFGSQNQLKRLRQDEATDWMASEIARGGQVGRRRFTPCPQGSAGLPGFYIYALLSDHLGRLWVGTDHGLAWFEAGTNAGSFTAVPALAGAEVFALGEDSAGTVWAGTDRGLFFSAGGAWRALAGMPRDLVLSLAPAGGERVWCGTYRSGVVRVDGNSVRTYSPRNSPLADTIFGCVAADQDGRLWAGTPDGLIHFDGQRWTQYTRENSGLPSHRIHCLVCDERGRVWIGTDAGVTVYEGKMLERPGS